MKTLTLIAALTLAAPLAAQDLSCMIVKLERKVEISRNEGAWEPAATSMKLAPGDKIHTGFKAVCHLKFPDGSTMQVKPMSLVLLQKLDDGDGKLKSRVWLRLGEVSATVNRSTGAAADFNVKTPTTTASVRGTVIDRIAYHPGTGTIVAMGSRGLLDVHNQKGHAALPANDRTQVTDDNASPLTPEEVTLSNLGAQVQPVGTTAEEQEDVRDAGVPKTEAFNQGGTGFLSVSLTTQAQAAAPAPVAPVNTTPVTVNIPVLP